MNLVRKSLLLLVLMLVASALAVVLRPTKKIADQLPPIDLTTLIPRYFADWHEEQQIDTYIVDPQQKATIEKIYNQTLSRTYVNADGYHVMLSVAYGGDQSDSMQVHKPEVCYPAQGFQLLNMKSVTIALPFGSLAVSRLDTQLGHRRERITYWITVGDRVVQNGIQKKLAEMRYGVVGTIPDGMLVRVSSIDTDAQQANHVQDTFVRELLSAMSPKERARVAGGL